MLPLLRSSWIREATNHLVKQVENLDLPNQRNNIKRRLRLFSIIKYILFIDSSTHPIVASLLMYTSLRTLCKRITLLTGLFFALLLLLLAIPELALFKVALCFVAIIWMEFIFFNYRFC